MLKEVEQLLVLQERDQRIQELRRQVEGLPREKAGLEKRLAEKREHLAAARAAAQKVEADRKNLDLQVQGLQGQIGKYKTQLNLTRKNDEYSALLHEIEHAEKEIARVEEAELGLMEQYDLAQKAVAREAAAEAEFEKGVSAQIQAVDEKFGVVTARLGELEKERAELAAGVEPGLLSRYERVLANKGDRALVPVEHGTTCGGCHMKLPSQVVLDAKGGPRMVSCPNCGRFLYVAMG